MIRSSQDPADTETEYSATILEAVSLANIPTLILVLVHLTNDDRWLSPPFQPASARGLEDNDSGGLPETVQEEIRNAAFRAILDWHHGRMLPITVPTPEALVRMLSAAMGEMVPPEYGPMLAADLASESSAPAVSAIKRDSGALQVVVIGAGVSGLCAGVNLSRQGIPFTILERNAALGGTWCQNQYPGAAVDTPSHLYEYSFAPHDWPHYFATREEVASYLESVAERFDLRDKIQFGTSVQDVTWDEHAAEWSIRIQKGVKNDRLTAPFVISAVGAFNTPKTPTIPGLDTFDGPAVHTATWRNFSLRGKKVALVGNGASAMQVGPAIIDEVSSLTVFQRSPHWIAPFPKFHEAVPDAVRLLLREVPLYHKWYRARLGWMFNDRLHPSLQLDPSWTHPERSMNAANDRHREYFTSYILRQLADRPDLVDAVLPTYPPYGKRILLDNGWYRMLARDKTQLVTDSVREIRGNSLVTGTGQEYEVDGLILATGFDVVHWLSTLDVYGKSGKALSEAWDDDDPRAYLGLSVPAFPNFFILYGPNTQPGHGGSLIGAVEAQMHVVIELLTTALDCRARTVEITESAFAAYTERVDRAHEEMVWAHPAVESYYQNSRGRVVVNNPFRIVDFWNMTRHIDASAYLIK